MSQKSFKEFFLENILNFLWRQWSALGVAGGARTEDAWVIDPEALLIFSLEMARYEPRLFDEALDWLVVNGKWIDIQRLRGVIKTKKEETRRLMSAVACYTSHEAKTYQRKWSALAQLNRAASTVQREILFKTKDGNPYPSPREVFSVFQNYGFLREEFSLRKMSKSVSVTAGNTLRFLLRSLFGIGSRSECILYLLTHEAGHPTEIASAVGISVRGTQDTLIELAESGLVLTRVKGKRKIEYWLSQKRWWEFLSSMNLEEMKTPIWIDWISLYSALMSVWEVLQEIEKTKSDYMRSSKLREAMDTISIEFSKSRLDLPPIPGSSVRPEKYEEEFQIFITKMLRT
jgi:predicted transcriptional regulator